MFFQKNNIIKYIINYDVVTKKLPAAISSWRERRSLENVHQIHQELLATYRNDFAKYAGRIPIERLDEILMGVPKMLGEKFVYSHVNKSAQPSSVKKALQLLTQAKLCYKVNCSSANGVPLAAESKENFFKVIYLDVGLVSAALGFKLDQFNKTDEIALINKGGLSEQIVGQMLRATPPFYVEPNLYYWAREQKNSSAEIDYVVQHNSKIIPIEVKTGSTGSLKSLHLFMLLKRLGLAVRINSDLPSKMNVSTKTSTKELVQYKLLSLPFYLVGQIHRLLDLELATTANPS